jgi:hypothetical protein
MVSATTISMLRIVMSLLRRAGEPFRITVVAPQPPR